VVIIGGGFGGLCAARGLAGAPVSVTLVDKLKHDSSTNNLIGRYRQMKQ
jgi:2-polyprenyl-6-methoxyphenol hydroxylase-like FAD-dependent oxidoreductase